MENTYTKRCPYCRPQWAYGIQNRLLRRIVAAIWPPHVYGGPDNGGPYTDGMCPKASDKVNAEMDKRELEVWKARWARWQAAADAIVDRRVGPQLWRCAYQVARRIEMGVDNACEV